jgi:CBS domain-containing protein
MKTVRRLLQARQNHVHTVSPDAPASEALRTMADYDIGALLVTNNEQLVGIVTERDMARKLGVIGRDPAATPVREIMSDRVLYVRPEQTIEECMALMTDKHLRHLPVLDGGRVLGIVSMRDVIADVIAEQSFIIEQLENYIYAIPPYSRA